MTATFTAVPPSSAPASNGAAPAAGGAVAQRVPLEQFDSVFGSLIGTLLALHCDCRARAELYTCPHRYHSRIDFPPHLLPLSLTLHGTFRNPPITIPLMRLLATPFWRQRTLVRCTRRTRYRRLGRVLLLGIESPQSASMSEQLRGPSASLS